MGGCGMGVRDDVLNASDAGAAGSGAKAMSLKIRR